MTAPVTEQTLLPISPTSPSDSIVRAIRAEDSDLQNQFKSYAVGGDLESNARQGLTVPKR
jgi:hypothetical protein